MRESWTDERLDDGFDRVSADIRLLRDETQAMRVEMRQEIGSVRGEIDSVRQELRQGIDSVRQELRQGIGSVRLEMHQEIGSVRGEIAALRQGFDDLRNILMYVGGAMVVGMLGVLVAAFGILISLT